MTFFYQFTILTQYLNCWLTNLGIFFTVKKVITNFLNSFNIHRQASSFFGRNKKYIYFLILYIYIYNFYFENLI